MLRSIREAVSYIAEYRGKIIVVRLDDTINPTDALEDIALLVRVGLRIVVVASEAMITPETFRVISGVMEIRDADDRDGMYQTIMAGKIAVVADPAGHPIDTDQRAEKLAVALSADKLLYVTNVKGICRSGELVNELQLDEAKLLLQSSAVTGGVRRKLECAVAACEKGVARVHIIGSDDDALIGELLTSQGIGTMIYRTLYHSVRPARHEDLAGIRDILAQAELRQSLYYPGGPSFQLEQHLQWFFVFVSDDHVHGCMMVEGDAEGRFIQVSYLCESGVYERSHVPMKALIDGAFAIARKQGRQHVILPENRNVLWLETFDWFTKDLGFRRGGLGDIVPSIPEEHGDVQVWYANATA